MEFVRYGGHTKTSYYGDFQVRRGAGDVTQSEIEKSKDFDIEYEGDVVGLALRAPTFADHDTFEDYSSLTNVEGTVENALSKKERVSDFKVTDKDDQPNLKVVLSTDMEGDGRLNIQNHGTVGGRGEIEFPLGKLRSTEWGDLIMADHRHEAQSVSIHTEKNFAEVQIERRLNDPIVFQVRNGHLYTPCEEEI